MIFVLLGFIALLAFMAVIGCTIRCNDIWSIGLTAKGNLEQGADNATAHSSET